MVEIVAVDRSLGLADSGKSAVKGVSVPVDNEAEAAEPKEVDVHAAEDVPGSDHYRTECADECQCVRYDPFRLPLGQPDKGLLLDPVQDGGLYSFRFLVCHINYVLDVFDVNPGSLVEVMLEFAPQVLHIVVLLKLAGALDVLDAVLVHPAADLGDDHGVDTFVLVFI